jgi:hypothetical protein
MKKKILLLALLIYSITTVGQDNFALKVDKSTGRMSGEFWKAVRGRRLTSLAGGYQHASFFNTLYYSNVEDEIIEEKGGYWITYSFNIAPVLLDVSYFNSSFGVESSSYYSEYSEKSTSLHGISVFASYAPLLSDFGKFSEIFQPYIGIGYQNSSLRATIKEGEGEGKEAETKLLGSYGASGAMWKGGLKLQFGTFCIRGEYQQSLSVTTPEAFRLIQIGVGFGLFLKHKN